MATIVTEGVEPHQNDIKCGRGNGSNMHPGNKYYQQRVLEFKTEYKESRGNYHKNQIAQTILDDIESRSPPGRFLESSHANGQEIWLIMDRGTAIKKIKQALRDVKKGSSSSKTSTKTSPSTPPPTYFISPPRPTTIQSEEVINYPEQVSQNHQHYENNDYDNNEWSSPRSRFATSMPTLPSIPLVAQTQEHIATRDFSSSLPADPQNFQPYFAHISSTTRRTTGAGIGVSTDSATGLNRNSSNSSADVELLWKSLESIDMVDSLISVDMEAISETLFDEQK